MISAANKFRTVDALAAMRVEWKRMGKTVVWTNGCFDLLHAGHVRSLRAAKALGDILIVGLNSDACVRAIKGRMRPLMPEQDRVEVIAALEAVDYVTLFDDPEPSPVLARIQPDIHCKGEDYAPGTGRPVPERDIILAYGGRIEFLPLFEGRSTSQIVGRILASTNGAPGEASKLNRAIFLDRDGTIIEDVGYLSDAQSIRPLSGSLETLRALSESGWLLIVITNQSGVGRGLISSEELLEVRSDFEAIMRRAGAPITATYCCVHTPEENCGCRKPSPSLFFQAATENRIDLSQSWMIGDRESDILSGRSAGCSTIWLRNNVHPLNPELADFVVNDWREIGHILGAAPSNSQILGQ